MTFPAQVWHVMAKDVREVRWALGLYAGLVIAVTVHVSGWLSETGLASPLWMIVVVLVGIVTTGLVLLTDPPVRVDAFWVSRPLSPIAVLLAKVAIAAAIVAIGTVGQFAALSAFDLPLTDAATQAGHAALSFFPLLLVALAIAASTNDVRSFVLALVVIPVLMSGGAFAPPIRVSPDVVRVLGAARAMVVTAAPLILLAWLYRARDVGVRRRAIVCGAVLLLFFGPPSLRSTEISGARLADATRLPYGSVQLAPLREADFTRQVGLSAMIDLPSGSIDLELVEWQATFYLGDTSFTAPQNKPASLAWSSLPAISGVRWLPPMSQQRPVGISVSLSASQRMLLGRGVDSIAIEGDLIATEAIVAATVPVVPQTRLASHGRRFFIEDIAHDGRHASLDLEVTSLHEGDYMRRSPFSTNFALVNRRRHEAMPLNGSGSGGSSGGLVLPGTPMGTYRHELTSEPRFDSPTHPIIDASWMAGSELIAIEGAPRGRHRVRLTTVMPAGGR